MRLSDINILLEEKSKGSMGDLFFKPCASSTWSQSISQTTEMLARHRLYNPSTPCLLQFIALYISTPSAMHPLSSLINVSPTSLSRGFVWYIFSSGMLSFRYQAEIKFHVLFLLGSSVLYDKHSSL